MKTGIIQQSLSGFYDILADDKVYRTRARGNFRKKGQKPLVGDRVEFSEEGYLLKILPRKNALVRPLVANVDVAVVVTAVTEPEFSANLLDRQLVALAWQGVPALLYFSKTDLLTPEKYATVAKVATGYREVGYQVWLDPQPFASTTLAQLTAELKGKVVTMMGQTGAGKSTLLNHLVPSLNLKTGEISKALKRGRHTTRTVSLLSVNGALVADTPGFSSYEDFPMTIDDLPNLFYEFKALAPQCKFRGCRHLKEPGCAVKSALEDGKIMQSRYDDYCQFHDLIINQKPNY
ncbi:ribosome small subunit-dependent GTPase A [Lactobacillus sp. 3B(2020)]|uniref:ribosome small subunit-dependent GTPase A n=1 Tax=Lactobacillus sp. 3B(2020) TaxID=2695882 RepID=UPI0015DD8E0E|nr:ribosome small subunit-dependent GTPase A [Lactobacillus sp. 3B(2020)]QLL70197.1 ribosome small subunit-dependent GTPase A [Lactobacillus sp. 3B(2020)]